MVNSDIKRIIQKPWNGFYRLSSICAILFISTGDRMSVVRNNQSINNMSCVINITMLFVNSNNVVYKHWQSKELAKC